MAESFWRSVRGLAANRQPALHMPGHGNGFAMRGSAAGALPQDLLRLDQSEMGGLDYLHEPLGPLREAQVRAARLFGADRSWFLINGATVGNLAAAWAVARPGGRLITMRRSHQSVHAALAMSGLKPSYLTPIPHLPLDGLFAFDLGQLAAILAFERDIVGVHVTSPDYYGFRLPLEQITDLCHAAGVPLIVDEAHGCHLYFLDGEVNALSSGADLVIHSPHKTLGSLTQSAVLHHRGGYVDADRVSESLTLMQSSSPSSLLTMSLDAVFEELECHGREIWSERAEWVRRARDTRSTGGTTLFLPLDEVPSGVTSGDPCKLIFPFTQRDAEVAKLRAQLESEYDIRPELIDHRSMVFTAGRGTTRADLLALCTALLEAVHRKDEKQSHGSMSVWPSSLPDQGCDARDAMQALRAIVPLRDAAGQTAAKAITPYPPGVPLLLPGEVISADVVRAVQSLLDAGMAIRGLADTSEGKGISCIRPETRARCESTHRLAENPG